MRTIDMAAAAARVNANMERRMHPGTVERLGVQIVWARELRAEIHILAECIADEALRGEEHYTLWLDEYRAACQMRTRNLAAFDQEQARRRAERHEAAGCTGAHS